MSVRHKENVQLPIPVHYLPSSIPHCSQAAANSSAGLQAGRFRFYIHAPPTAAFRPGDVVTGRGTLLFDHYIWVKYLSEYPDPPDLFYRLRVDALWQRRIPERFISRGADGSMGWPTRLQPEEYGPEDVSQADAVSDENFVDYVIQLSDLDIPKGTIPRTFYS